MRKIICLILLVVILVSIFIFNNVSTQKNNSANEIINEETLTTTSKVVIEETPAITSNDVVIDETLDTDYWSLFNNSKTIIVKEKFFSIGKGYEIFILNEGKELKIGEIKGKPIVAFRDIFTFYDNDGNILSYEKEVFKGLKLTRTAELFSADHKLFGYIGEDLTTNLFDPGHFFYYYDADRNKIGSSDEKSFSFFKSNDVYNVSGTREYTINQKVNYNDVYEISVIVDEPSIPRIYVLFSTCIEDAIDDSEDAETD